MFQRKCQSGVRKPQGKQQLKVIYSQFIICGFLACLHLCCDSSQHTNIPEVFLAFTSFSFWQLKQESKCQEITAVSWKKYFNYYLWSGTCGTQYRCKSTKLNVFVYGNTCWSHLSRSTKRQKTPCLLYKLTKIPGNGKMVFWAFLCYCLAFRFKL